MASNTHRNPNRWLAIVLALHSTTGCLRHPSESSTEGPAPIGTVAHDAAEAFPDRPSTLPAISGDDIVKACVVFAACKLGPSDGTATGVGYCVGQMEWSAERAVPISALLPGLERVEHMVPCLIGAADCTAASRCFHERPGDTFYCEEDGCRAAKTEVPSVTCSGSVATVKYESGTISRDCSAAFAGCDAESPTGCTDRPFTQCSDAPDRCEGDVRLGCDSHGQVSYRDCGRMGGTCTATGDGSVACAYGETGTECTGGNVIFSHCEGTDVVLCSLGRKTVVPAPELCSGP